MKMLAVIGSAGRKDDARRISRPLYDAMHGHALAAADEWQIDGMVSGGAAVSDHLAVRAYLEGRIQRLVLFLPSAFDSGRFRENPRDRQDAGRTANRYHRGFSESCGLDSLAELAAAITKGAEVHVLSGFKRRNLEVAALATHMIAFTFGADRAPETMLPASPGFTDSAAAGLKDGGTAHTWGEAWRCAEKRHVSLTWLERSLASSPSVLR